MAESPKVPSANTPPTSAPAPKPPATPTPAASGPFAALEAKFYEWFVYKAPFQFPVALTDFIVTFGPWITLVLGILFLPVFFGALAVLSFFGSVAVGMYGYQPGLLYWLSLIVLLVQVIIMFVSIPMLLKRQRKGWQLLFYASLISVVYGAINSLAYGYFAVGSLLLTLVGAVISMFVLFQIRSRYVK